MPAQPGGVAEGRLAAVGAQRLVTAHGSIVRVTAASSFPAMHVDARRFVALVACSAAIALAPGRAMAHTELEFSLPANGTTVGEPVAEIIVGFTDQVALVGNGFEVHDPQGNLLTPFVVTDDNTEFKFQLDPPLAGGVVVVDYHIRALDGDEQQGSFSFTVAAPVPSSTTPATTAAATAPATTAPATTAQATTTPATTDVTTTRAAADQPAPTTAAPTTPATTLSTVSDDDGERTVTFAVLIGVAALAAGFLVVRSRRTA
jgi:methionine-rich copper-binding protein CopC